MISLHKFEENFEETLSHLFSNRSCSCALWCLSQVVLVHCGVSPKTSNQGGTRIEGLGPSPDPIVPGAALITWLSTFHPQLAEFLRLQKVQDSGNVSHPFPMEILCYNSMVFPPMNHLYDQIFISYPILLPHLFLVIPHCISSCWVTFSGDLRPV